MWLKQTITMWLTITSDNRTWRLWEKTEGEQRYHDSPQISRTKEEFHVNQNEPSRLPSFGCLCGTWCAELTLNDRWAWGEISDESLKLFDAELLILKRGPDPQFPELNGQFHLRESLNADSCLDSSLQPDPEQKWWEVSHYRQCA
jgi:hypothetical protein